MMSLSSLLAFLILLVATISLDECTLSKSDRKKAKSLHHENEIGSDDFSTSEHAIIHKSLQSFPVQQTLDSIIRDQSQNLNQTDCVMKHFNATVLAYVTPWNNFGYKVSEECTRKFNFISPVWLQLKVSKAEKEVFKIYGEHDIDQKWMEVLRNGGSRIVPRLLFDEWKMDDYLSVADNEYVASGCSNVIRDFLLTHKFDGVVLEVWSQLGSHAGRILTHFLSHIANDLRSSGLISILVIPPAFDKYQQTNQFSSEHFRALFDYIDYFSLMTYDYSNVMSSGPNAPVGWIESCIQVLEPTGKPERRSKILMGLNFYGMLYTQDNGQPIIGNQFVNYVNTRHPRVEWNDKYYEHVFHFRHANRDYRIFYPTRSSISIRLQLARQLGVGISIWEIGQGLPYFYELL